MAAARAPCRGASPRLSRRSGRARRSPQRRRHVAVFYHRFGQRVRVVPVRGGARHQTCRGQLRQTVSGRACVVCPLGERGFAGVGRPCACGMGENGGGSGRFPGRRRKRVLRMLRVEGAGTALEGQPSRLGCRELGTHPRHGMSERFPAGRACCISFLAGLLAHPLGATPASPPLFGIGRQKAPCCGSAAQPPGAAGGDFKHLLYSCCLRLSPPCRLKILFTL